MRNLKFANILLLVICEVGSHIDGIPGHPRVYTTLKVVGGTPRLKDGELILRCKSGFQGLGSLMWK